MVKLTKIYVSNLEKLITVSVLCLSFLIQAVSQD